MPIDAEKLRAFVIPSVREFLTPRDAALYALSVGMGRDPSDLSQLPFVDPLAGPVAMPAMALVLAHPGFWLGDPQSGVDPLSVLHAGQVLELSGPVPVEGDVESRTQITRLIDKGAGKAALLYTETVLTYGDGREFARLNRTTIIRGGGGFGGTDFEPATVARAAPEGPPDIVSDLTTGREQALLYRLNGDLNPLHSDPAVAVRSGFERPILHGLCTMGVIVHALLRARLAYRTERLRSVSLKFTAPVMPGETIRTEIWKDGAFRARVVERDIVVADQGWCDCSEE
jgi:acyl dehydratase